LRVCCIPKLGDLLLRDDDKEEEMWGQSCNRDLDLDFKEEKSFCTSSKGCTFMQSMIRIDIKHQPIDLHTSSPIVFTSMPHEHIMQLEDVMLQAIQYAPV
jgi:hypothetical protein